VNHLPWHPGVAERVGFESFSEYLESFTRASGTELLCYDCYSQMLPEGRGLPMYWRNLETYRDASLKLGIPFWNTILSVGHFHYRCPSEDDMRWQFNTSIAYGAKGILYFFFYMRHPHDNYRLSPIDELWDRTPLFYTLKRLNHGFLRRWGSLMLGLTSKRVMHRPVALIPEAAAFEPTELVAGADTDVPDHPLLISEFDDGGGRPYMMVTNNSYTGSILATLRFKGANTRIFGYNWDGQEYEHGVVERQGGEGTTRVSQWLAPGQAEVYRVQL
jgi:hypothetical protein